MEEDRRCPSNLEDIGRSSACEGCPGQAICQAQAGADPDQAIINIRMKPIKHKILVISGKGGVGKSTVAALLALALAHRGFKVGFCDLDLCGPSAAQIFNVADVKVTDSQYGWIPAVSHDNIKVISSALLLERNAALVYRGPRKTALIKRFLKDTLWGKLDFLIFDTPPGTSDEHLAVSRYLRHDCSTVLVTTPGRLVVQTARKSVAFCRKLHLPILGLINNMSFVSCESCEERTFLHKDDAVVEFCSGLDIPSLGSMPYNPQIARCGDDGSDPLSRDRALRTSVDTLITNLLLQLNSDSNTT